MGMSVSLRVVPSSTGLPSKRCPGVRFLSRVDREFGIFQHMAPTLRLLFEFPHETGLILRCARKAGNPFQTKQGNRFSCRDQEGRWGSDEVVPGPSVFHWEKHQNRICDFVYQSQVMGRQLEEGGLPTVGGGSSPACCLFF